MQITNERYVADSRPPKVDLPRTAFDHYHPNTISGKRAWRLGILDVTQSRMGLRVLFVALAGENTDVHRRMWARPVSVQLTRYANQAALLGVRRLSVYCICSLQCGVRTVPSGQRHFINRYLELPDPSDIRSVWRDRG